MPRAPLTALVVDDDPGSLCLLTRLLRREGGRVLEARDGPGAAALGAGHRGRLDLLVTDIEMPGMDGWELARRVRASHPEAGVVYVSGAFAVAPYARHGGMPASAYLPKPFTRSELLAQVQRVLAERCEVP